jgi:HAD superfamily hydrolase (TIGR01509 family)
LNDAGLIGVAFDLVIFDCDGVLIDSEILATRAVVACLAEYGVGMSEDEILERYTGTSTADMVADLEARHGCALIDFDAREQRRLATMFVTDLRAIAGVEALLDALAAKRCVASSGTPERIRLGLSQVGLYDRFHPHIFSAAMVVHGKPAPDLFLYAAGQMGAAPGRCIVIEDSLPGTAAAVAAGMIPVGFVGASHCRPDHAARLAAAGAVRIAATMPELQTILLDLSG